MPRKKPRDKAKAKRIRSALIEVTSDDAFLDALIEAHSEGNARAQLKANPRSHLQGKGRPIPDEMNVEFTEDAGTWGVRLSFDEGEGRASGVDIRTGQSQSPETDPSDRGRYRRLQRELQNILTSDAYLDTVAEHEENEGSHAEFKADARASFKRKESVFPMKLRSRYLYLRCQIRTTSAGTTIATAGGSGSAATGNITGYGTHRLHVTSRLLWEGGPFFAFSAHAGGQLFPLAFMC